MLRISAAAGARTGGARANMFVATRMPAKTQVGGVRYAHGVHYGAAEPTAPYLKWIGVIGGIVGLIAYDRVYTDRAVSRWITPETDVAAIERQRQKFADRQIQEQDRNIELLYPRKRSTLRETFSAHPVPVGAYREAHTSEIVDPQSLSERRPRTKPQ